MTPATLGWLGIVRLGLVQTSLGSVVALTNSTLNRVMVVELALLAVLPGALVFLHYAVQLLRPRWGFGSDVGGRRSPWIIGGMVVLAVGGVLAASSTALMQSSLTAGIALAAFAYALIGIGVGASGTNLLALLATRAAPERRAIAAAVVWLMMIAGIVVTSKVGGGYLDPFSFDRLITVAAAVGAMAIALTALAMWGMEGAGATPQPAEPSTPRAPPPAFATAMAQVWSESGSRRFALFVFVAMLAYNAQDLILEPFAGLVFNLTPGETTKLSGDQHAGVFLGMLLAGVAGYVFAGSALGSMRGWTVWGCAGSAIALVGISVVGLTAQADLIRPAVFLLGAANGAFAVAAIGSMMGLASSGREKREGTRMGLWGAAQAMAFGLGGFSGTVAVDLMRLVVDQPALAYGLVFAAEGVLFLLAAYLAARIVRSGAPVQANGRANSPPRHGRLQGMVG